MFVCLGNICRSPLAEALFRQKVNSRNLQDHFHIESSGTSNYHIGENADPRTIETAAGLGVSLDHSAQQLSVQHMNVFDYVIAMDESNFTNATKLDFNNTGLKLLKMRYFDPSLESETDDVPDPWFGGSEGFKEVHNILDRCTTAFLEHLIKEHHLI